MGVIAAPFTSAALQDAVKVGPMPSAPRVDTCLVLTDDGEVRRFTEEALRPVDDEVTP